MLLAHVDRAGSWMTNIYAPAAVAPCPLKRLARVRGGVVIHPIVATELEAPFRLVTGPARHVVVIVKGILIYPFRRRQRRARGGRRYGRDRGLIPILREECAMGKARQGYVGEVRRG